jgi:putative Ca2+/H+ antiporter (TMEM165/GDT1 family)
MSLVLVFLTEFGGETFVVVTHLAISTSKLYSLLTSLLTINLLYYGSTKIGEAYIGKWFTSTQLGYIIVFTFFTFGVYNLTNYLYLKKKFDIE